MKRRIILAVLALAAQTAFSQECSFEGIITTTEQIGKGRKMESVTYYKNGNSVCEIAHLKTTMLFKDGVLYTIDYSSARPTVSVMNASSSDYQHEGHSSISLEKEVINGRSCIKVQGNSKGSAGFFTISRNSQIWIDTSFCLQNSDSPSGKGLTVKKISSMEMNGRKNTTTTEFVSAVECPVADSLFYLPDTTEARYIYAKDIIKAAKNPSDTSLLKKIADFDPQENTELKHCTTIDDNTFSKSIKKGISVVDFSAVWCKPCKMLQPVLDTLAEKNSRRAKFYTMDIDKSPKTTKTLGIKAVPVVIVLKNGVEVGRIEGFYPDMEQQINDLITTAETL